MTAAPLLTADDTEHDGVVNAVDDATMQSSSRRNFIIMALLGVCSTEHRECGGVSVR